MRRVRLCDVDSHTIPALIDGAPGVCKALRRDGERDAVAPVEADGQCLPPPVNSVVVLEGDRFGGCDDDVHTVAIGDLVGLGAAGGSEVRRL